MEVIIFLHFRGFSHFYLTQASENWGTEHCQKVVNGSIIQRPRLFGQIFSLKDIQSLFFCLCVYLFIYLFI